MTNIHIHILWLYIKISIFSFSWKTKSSGATSPAGSVQQAGALQAVSTAPPAPILPDPAHCTCFCFLPAPRGNRDCDSYGTLVFLISPSLLHFSRILLGIKRKHFSFCHQLSLFWLLNKSHPWESFLGSRHGLEGETLYCQANYCL